MAYLTVTFIGWTELDASGIYERPRWLKRKRYRKKLIGCIEKCIR